MKIQKDKIMLTWFFTYILITVMSIFLFFTSYFITKDVMMKEISKSNKIMLNQVKMIYDNSFTLAEKMLPVLSGSDSIAEFAKNLF